MLRKCCLLFLISCASAIGGFDGQSDNETSESAKAKINALMKQLPHTWINAFQRDGQDMSLYNMTINMRAMLPKVGLTEISSYNGQAYDPAREWESLHANLDAIFEKLSKKNSNYCHV